MDWLDGVKDKFGEIGDAIIEILPKSPISFIAASPEAEKVMGYVNFFIPIYSMIAILEAWLTAIVVYYVVQVILRWAKVVE